MKPKILYVEDDLHIAKLTSHYLRKHHYDVTTLNHGSEAWNYFQQNRFDFVILDIMLPGMDGWQICKNIRYISNVPIIMLTAKGEVGDRVHGLQFGADDYMVKPFDPQELIARIQAVLRRSEKQTNAEELNEPRIEFGSLIIEPLSYQVFFEGKPIEFPRREFDLLYFMTRNPNRVFSRNDLIEQVWGWDFQGEDRVVDLYITRIRQRFEHGMEQQNWQLRTIRGVGYKFEVNR